MTNKITAKRLTAVSDPYLCERSAESLEEWLSRSGLREIHYRRRSQNGAFQHLADLTRRSQQNVHICTDSGIVGGEYR